MTIARATRLLLAFASLLIVVWSFWDVTVRAIAKHRLEHSRPITLTLLHWGDKAEDVIVNDLIASYEREHPNVHIIRINPTYLSFRPKLKTMMAAGTPPDIFYLPPDVLPELRRRDYHAADDYVGKGARRQPEVSRRLLADF
jgi:ABC-type glycerol-3-phosphate transport system substrate-binding protein